MSTTYWKKCILKSLTFLIPATVAHADPADYQVCGLYLGENPSGQTAWSEEVSGLAHDDTHWYITMADPDYDGSDHAYIWRIPAWVNLNLSSLDLITTPGVSLVDVHEAMGQPDNVSLRLQDPVVYRFGGVDYLLFGDSDGPTICPGYAYYFTVFEGATLTAVDWVLLPCGISYSVAVDPQGMLYFYQVAGGGTLRKAALNWSLLQSTGQISLTFTNTIQLRDEAGLPFDLGVDSMEFTADGRFLYVVTSFDGIHVFDTSTWRRVLQSTNGSNPFNLQFHSFEQSVQGLTLWDLDAISSPYDGQLHVPVKDDDDFNDDDVFLKHYSNVIHVQAGASPTGNGSVQDPFPTVTAGANAAWFGSQMHIGAANYNEELTISTRVRISSVGGTARIGG